MAEIDDILENGYADVQCQHCQKTVPQPFFVKKIMGRLTRHLPFCNERCANEYYLEHLRRSGL